jgi:hypothetical protein
MLDKRLSSGEIASHFDVKDGYLPAFAGRSAGFSWAGMEKMQVLSA